MDACICKKGLSVAMRLLYSRTGFQKRIKYIRCCFFTWMSMKENIPDIKLDVEEMNCKMTQLQTEVATTKVSCIIEKQCDYKKNSCKPSKLQPRIDTCEMVKKRKPGIERSRNSHGRVPHSRKRDISIMTTLCDSMKLRARFWSELLKLLRYKCL